MSEENVKRRFNIGDNVICEEGHIIGKVIRFYVPTACEEQTLVLTTSGFKYHAPTRMWNKFSTDIALTAYPTNLGSLLNPYGKYVVEFAENHAISIKEAQGSYACKARYDYFNATGR